MFNVFGQDNEKEQEKGSYFERLHQDNNYQYCRSCEAERIFVYDRCEVCKNN